MDQVEQAPDELVATPVSRLTNVSPESTLVIYINDNSGDGD